MAIESPLREVHERTGATMGVWFGAELPADYGDFDLEYRHARAGVAAADTNFQLVAELTGADRVRYLNAITSGNVQALEPGNSTVGLLLNPQGHILAELLTLALPDRLIVLSHAMVADRTLSTLDKYIIMDDVTLVDRSREFSTVALLGPAVTSVVRDVAGLDLGGLSEGGHAEVRADTIECRIIRSTSLGLSGVEWIVGRSQVSGLWSILVDAAARHGGGPAGYRALDALRIEAGIPWFGTDFDDRVIPHEAGLEQSHISYTKGCYTGQEIVERVRSRGQVNRRLVGLGFSGTAVPESGARLVAGNEEVGRVTSAAFSPLAERPLGMGYLRRDFHSAGSRVAWNRGEAEVIALPLSPSPES